MLSFKEAKKLIEDYEKIEKEVKELSAAKRKIDLSIEEKINLMADIEAVFEGKAKEAPKEEFIAEAHHAEARKKEFMKAVVVDGPKDELPVNNTPEEPKEAVEAPKAVSPYRIKGDK